MSERFLNGSRAAEFWAAVKGYVDEHSGSGRSGDYSTEEQRIGTWIDGKPIYRRVFKVRLAETETITTVAKVEWDSLVKIYGWLDGGGQAKFPINSDPSSTTKYWTAWVGVAGDLFAMTMWPDFHGCNVTLIAEYTKTTD